MFVEEVMIFYKIKLITFSNIKFACTTFKDRYSGRISMAGCLLMI